MGLFLRLLRPYDKGLSNDDEKQENGRSFATRERKKSQGELSADGRPCLAGSVPF